MSSFLFVVMTVTFTGFAAWFFGSGLGRDSGPRQRELSGSGHPER